MASTRMAEIRTDAICGSREENHEDSPCCPDGVSGSLGLLASRARLQIPVEALIRVGFRPVRRELEDLDRIGPPSGPLLLGHSVVDPKVVQDQEDLAAPGVGHHPLHEVDQTLGVDRALAHRETHRPLVGDWRVLRHIRPARRRAQDQRLSGRRVVSLLSRVLPYGGLVAPLDLGALSHGAVPDRRVLRLQPVQHVRCLLPKRPLRQALWAHPPTVKVHTHGPDRRLDARHSPNNVVHRPTDPEREEQQAMIGVLAFRLASRSRRTARVHRGTNVCAWPIPPSWRAKPRQTGFQANRRFGMNPDDSCKLPPSPFLLTLGTQHQNPQRLKRLFRVIASVNILQDSLDAQANCVPLNVSLGTRQWKLFPRARTGFQLAIQEQEPWRDEAFARIYSAKFSSN